MVTLQTSTLPSTLEDEHASLCLYHHGEIDEVVLESIARADSYWRIAYRYLEMVIARADSYWSIAYRYLEMVTLQTSTLPSTSRTTRFPVFCTATRK